MPTVAVLGSCNVDLVTTLDRFPAPGETRAARGFAIHPGGKGANQAVAVGRLAAPGTRAAMFGAVGDDPLHRDLVASLVDAGVDVSALERLEGVETGTASIWVDGRGENAIAIHAGANARVDADYVRRHLAALRAADWLLLQNEIPLEAVHALVTALDGEGPRLVLDPAPAPALADLPAHGLWLLTPNEHELAALVGEGSIDGADAVASACARLADATGATRVVVKAGADGAWWFDATASGDARLRRIPGFAVAAVDTTAAGDTFNGALVAALAAGATTDRAVRFAHAAAAIAVTRPGAQTSIPTRGEVEAFRAERDVDG